MRLVNAALVALVFVLISPIPFLAQSSQPEPSVSVPRLVHITGMFQPVDGRPPAAVEVVTLSIYAEQAGGSSLWQERQTVVPEKTGRFTLLLGATYPDGIPPEVFASGDARWMSLLFERAGEVEQPRVRITSVPYALKASDAVTLGGLPASAYLRAPTAEPTSAAGRESSLAGSTDPPITAAVVLPGTTNFLAKYVNGADVGNSAVYETPTARVPTGAVGIGTTTPADVLHLRFTNTNGAITGLAVQNLGTTATSYSGMLFYDHLGALAQFQGFNNITHEYRINNVATNPSINFMTGNASRFFVGPSGSIGIGTTSPSPTANLDVSNAISGSGTTNVNVTTFSPNASGPNLIGKKARGTQGAPTSVLNNDALLDLSANGYGATGFAGVNSASISMRASQNWTDTAQGSIMNFSTTANNTTVPISRMTIGSNGNVGIGVFGAQANLEVSNANGVAGAGMMYATTFTNAGTSLFVGRRARGTGVAPTGVLAGDNLVGFEGAGYGTTGFSFTRGGMLVTAAENWTDAAQGARLHFITTATGTTTGGTRMTIDPVGNVGIGTSTPSAAVEVVRETGRPLELHLTRYGGSSSSGEPNLLLRTARGTAAAPTAVQAGDELGGFSATGYGATDFGESGVGMAGVAAENWTDTAQGAALAFWTTPLGSTEAQPTMITLANGNTGIGLPIGSGLPVITDRLEVFGDIRVGTTGTNGCLKNFAGTGIAGTCPSDRRFKRDITPFSPVLNQVAALQPVHYFWRAADFPQQHFGDSRAYGLIAQDVEEVLPELVVTGEDGFKAVDYTKLPLLTIQAVKELKAENENLKQRVDELERMFRETLATVADR